MGEIILRYIYCSKVVVYHRNIWNVFCGKVIHAAGLFDGNDLYAADLLQNSGKAHSIPGSNIQKARGGSG